jgi:chemotaxis protein methyltransferase WspC
MNSIETLLRTEIGLDPVSIGSRTIARAASLRMKAVGLKSSDEYLRLLRSSRAERGELVEAIVVTETWFFRDHEAFLAFAYLVQEWLAQNTEAPVRVLSVPCSSGEEPYSLAMSLLDAGVAANRFIIDAVDVSGRSLARAIRGVYGINSFREPNLLFRDRYFRQTKHGHELDASVRQCVHFQQDNLLSSKFLAGNFKYHFIFCRNVLIYFDAEAQAKAVRMLRNQLSPDGTVFVGAAELPILLNHGFISLNIPLTFACRQADTPSRLSSSAQPTRLMRCRSLPKTTPLLPDASSRQTGETLDDARKLADSGRFTEASEICHRHIRLHGPSARAYCLLGLIHDATGNLSAADCYRKALYLDPDHYETLWHLALLLEKNGHHTDAHAFKRRAERAQQNASGYQI